MDKLNIPLADLKIGMYVELPSSWLSHDFLKNNFKITTQKQLLEIKKLKLKGIKVDFSKSDIEQPHLAQSKPKQVEVKAPTVVDPKYEAIPEKWSSEELMTDDLRNVLEDKNLGAKEKSVMVYQNSVSMME